MKFKLEAPSPSDRSLSSRARHASQRKFWPAKLEMGLVCLECRVMRLSRAAALVRVARPIAKKQRVTVVMRRLGEFSGIVTWRRGDSIGIRIAERRGTVDGPKLRRRAGSAYGSERRSGDGGKAVRAPEGVGVAQWTIPELLDLFREERNTVSLEPGEILFKEGDPGLSMYVVRSGALRIRSGSVVYEDVGRGGVVGEMAIVERHMPRSATVYALTACELVELDEERFASLVRHTPSFAVTVMRVLSRRLRHMDTRYRVER